jgi:hypothetical protein
MAPQEQRVKLRVKQWEGPASPVAGTKLGKPIASLATDAIVATFNRQGCFLNGREGRVPEDISAPRSDANGFRRAGMYAEIGSTEDS